MITEKNFADALKTMNFTANGNRYEKIFADGVVMTADLAADKLSYPAQIQGRDRNTSCDKAHKENLVVFECVNRLLDKGYSPADIELEKTWQLGHSPKGGRADICVSQGGKVLFIIECKTAGSEFNHERANMQADGGQLFSYWQQENSCQWLVLYASDFKDGKLTFSAASIPCSKELYRDADTVPERFKVWSERYDKKFFDDVIFHEDTKAYQIGVPPLRKRDLKDFTELKSPVNDFEEILRHNQVSNKANAFDVLIALFICKLVDETLTEDDGEVSFQFMHGSDTYETFQDRLQRLYADGMERFMKEPITYVPLERVDDLLKQIGQLGRAELSTAFKDDYRKLKFFNNNAFAFIDVHNEKLFYLNGKVLVEVVRMLQNHFIIGSKDLQTLGDLFEQLLNKGFKQDEGQFFTPIPITRFIWDSLPLDEIIFREGHATPPKIIDYACGAGHFLTEGFQAVNDCFTRHELPPPVMWERDKLFGVEKDDRLARVSKISLFMHGANEGKIKFGDGLEDYPDENITPDTFDILVANPPYSVKGFKTYLRLVNDKLKVLDKISNDGSEIETLFVERISQLVKPRGVAAVILPSSILNKDGKSFIAARESLLKNFYVRAVVQLGSKTFGATGTNTVILFLQRIFDPPERSSLLKDSANIILNDAIQHGDEEADIFAAYTKKIGRTPADYRKALADADDKARKLEREKIIFFGLTYRQQTLIISAPDDNKEQEKFLGYGWSNAKGREGLIDKKRGGLLFDNDDRAADNTLAAVIRAAYRGEQLHCPALEKYFHYAALADLLDFDAADFTKKITLGSPDYAPVEYSGTFPLVKLGDHITQIRGVSYKPNDLHTELNDDAVILLRANNIGNGKINHDKVQFVSREKVSAAQIIRTGDILMCGSSGSLEHVGKAALCTEFVAGETFGAFCKVIRSDDSVLPEYVAIYLATPDCRKIIEMSAKGANINNLKNEHIDNLKMPLPPLDLQRQIVDEFTALDTKLAAQDEMISSLDADIKAKFTALFGDEKQGYKYPTDSFEKFVYVCGGDTFKEKYQGSKKQDDIPFYKVSDMNSAGNEKIMDKANNYVSEATLVNEIKATIFDEGTIIFPKVGMAIGTNKKRILGRRAAVDNNTMAIQRKNNLLDNEYLFAFLNFCVDLSSIASKANPPSISAKNFNRAKIMVPPLALQEEFASYVRNCEAMKKSARARREELVSARAELVTKYFR